MQQLVSVPIETLIKVSAAMAEMYPVPSHVRYDAVMNVALLTNDAIAEGKDPIWAGFRNGWRRESRDGFLTQPITEDADGNILGANLSYDLEDALFSAEHFAAEQDSAMGAAFLQAVSEAGLELDTPAVSPPSAEMLWMPFKVARDDSLAESIRETYRACGADEATVEAAVRASACMAGYTDAEDAFRDDEAASTAAVCEEEGYAPFHMTPDVDDRYDFGLVTAYADKAKAMAAHWLSKQWHAGETDLFERGLDRIDAFFDTLNTRMHNVAVKLFAAALPRDCREMVLERLTIKPEEPEDDEEAFASITPCGTRRDVVQFVQEWFGDTDAVEPEDPDFKPWHLNEAIVAAAETALTSRLSFRACGSIGVAVARKSPRWREMWRRHFSAQRARQILVRRATTEGVHTSAGYITWQAVLAKGLTLSVPANKIEPFKSALQAREIEVAVAAAV